MEDPKSVVRRQDFDRSGQYEAGLSSLVRSLKLAFVLLLAVIIGMLIYFFTGGGYFAVEPQRAVIVQRFGTEQAVFFTGGHWFLPYPVHQFIEIQTNPQTLQVDFTAAEALNNGANRKSLEPGRDSYLITADANIIHSSWAFSYRVNDPSRYYNHLSTPRKPVENNLVVGDDTVTDADGFTGTRGPQTMLRNLFKQAVIKVSASLEVNKMLGEMKGFYNDEVSRQFTKLVNEADGGIEVVNVTLISVYPPAGTKDAFDNVAAAYNTQSTMKNQALEYQVQTSNDTLARKAEILAEATTYRKRIVSEVKSESIYFESINREYAANPATVLMALYTSTLSDVLKNNEDKFVLGSGARREGGKKLWIRLNPEPRRQPGSISGTAQKTGEDK